MARTALTPVSLVWDTGTAQGSGATPDASNGNIIASPGPYNCILIIKNADSSPHNVILRGGGFTGNPTDAANSGLPLPAIFTQSSQGDLTVTVTNGTTKVIPISNTDRFTQSDGSLWLDWSASTSMTVYVSTLPYVVA